MISKYYNQPKFQVNDLVWILKSPPSMSHFPSGEHAIVVEYFHNRGQIGNDWEHNYELFIERIGEVSWYHDSNLKLIEHNRHDLLLNWELERNNRINEKR